MFFVVPSNDSFNFPQGGIKYIVIVVVIVIVTYLLVKHLSRPPPLLPHVVFYSLTAPHLPPFVRFV